MQSGERNAACSVVPRFQVTVCRVALTGTQYSDKTRLPLKKNGRRTHCFPMNEWRGVMTHLKNLYIYLKKINDDNTTPWAVQGIIISL